jgi:hypothetical protein
MRKEYRLGVFEGRVLIDVLGHTGMSNRKWRKLHSEEVHDLYILLAW